ncbi:Golgi apyrase [Mycena sanguinolenta]|uniref:Golgi apyrase n=1 Tax=Mycena sanguinolenta TaxID=230812 RepID=A0A8H7D685_9AGAR|nr:Golgi apyrase [Mycena sanguinolenta]
MGNNFSAFRYIIIMDAGSSGTRLFVYLASDQWTTDKKEPPKIGMMFQGKKKSGGIADLVKEDSKELEARAKAYLHEPIEQAKEFFKKQELDGHKMQRIPLYMLGTAGMRDLAKKPRDLLETAINRYLKNCGFDCNVTEGRGYRTISGEEEAAYGWIAANWSLGTFMELKQQSPQKYGYLEMGGASAQIAFLPHKHELTPEQLGDGDITRVTLGGVELDLFLKTYDLGSNKAWNEYEEELKSIGEREKTWEDVHNPVDSTGQTVQTRKRYVDPDSPRDRIWTNPKLPGVEFRGTGDFQPSRFQEKVRRVLNRLAPPQHARGSRLLDEDLIKTLERRRFVGGANFWYSTRTVFGQDINGDPKQGLFSFSEYDAEVNRTAMLSWPLLKLRLGSDDDIVGKAWFMAAWVKCVLAEGFGFNLVDQAVDSEQELSFRPYNGPGGEELTWTLGKIVQVVGGDVDIKPLSLVDVTDKHERAQIGVMREKAARCQELAWDYLSILCSLPDQKDPARDVNREDLARAAKAAVAVARLPEAEVKSKLGRDPMDDRLITEKQMLQGVHGSYKKDPARNVDKKDPARARRLEELARAALATAWSMRQAAAKLGGDAKNQQLIAKDEQLVVVRDLCMKISAEAKKAAAADGEKKAGDGEKKKTVKKTLLEGAIGKFGKPAGATGIGIGI